MRLTNRDIDLFKWVNGWGVTNLPQICRYWQVKYPTACARVRKLKDSGYLKVYRILHEKPGVVIATRKAIVISKDELKPLGKVNLGTLIHDLKCVDVALYFDNGVVPERRLRREYSISGVNNTRTGIHMPDFVFPDTCNPGKVIAVEIELSRKKKSRLEKIVRYYLTKQNYSKVIYYTDPSLTDFVRGFVDRYPQIFEVQSL